MILACLDVYTRSDSIEINGKETRIGTKEELWTQLQRCRVEKKVLEQVCTLGVKIRNLKVNFKTAGTWRRVGL